MPRFLTAKLTRPATDTAAAIRSDISQISRAVKKPPFDIPVA